MEFRNIKLSEHDQIQVFFEGFYGINYCEVEYLYYKWLHYDNPLKSINASDDECTSFAAFQDNSIISCINYVPMELYVDRKPYHSCWSVGWLTKDGYSGVSGLLLRKHFYKFNYYMSMGATQWVKTIYTQQFGFEYQHNIGRAIMIGASDNLISLLKCNKDITIINIDLIDKWYTETLKAAENGHYVFIKEIGALNGQYWHDHLNRCKATVSKDSAYINWRYFQHPHITYEIISTDTSQTSGIAVLRVETIRDSESRIVRMVEFLPTENNEGLLAQAVARYLIDKQALFLDFFCGSRYYLDRYFVSPFLLEKDHQPFFFPRMFQPLEWRERYSINASFGRNGRINALPKIHLDDVYFTKGDPSQDIVLNREYVTRNL